MRLTRIPVEKKRKRVMLCVRFDHFGGECSLYDVDKNQRLDDALLLRTSGGEGHMHCLALRSERGLAGNRLAYTVRVPADEESDPRARLVIVAFTKRKVLRNGCVEVEIPERPAGGTTKRLRGYIDFVPARNEAGTAKGRG